MTINYSEYGGRHSVRNRSTKGASLWQRCLLLTSAGGLGPSAAQLPGTLRARIRLHDHEKRWLIHQMKAETSIFSFLYLSRMVKYAKH